MIYDVQCGDCGWHGWREDLIGEDDTGFYDAMDEEFDPEARFCPQCGSLIFELDY